MLKLYTDDSPGLRVSVSEFYFGLVLILSNAQFQRPFHRPCPISLLHRIHLLSTHLRKSHKGIYEVGMDGRWVVRYTIEGGIFEQAVVYMVFLFTVRAVPKLWLLGRLIILYHPIPQHRSCPIPTSP